MPGPRGVGIPACTEAEPPPPPPGETATAADGTHPTKMHSYFNCEFAICHLVDGAKQYYRKVFPGDTLPLYLLSPRTLPFCTTSYHSVCITRATLYWVVQFVFHVKL